MAKGLLLAVLLAVCLEAVRSRGCSSFFCGKSLRVSGGSDGQDPGKPLFLSPYLERGEIDKGKVESLEVKVDSSPKQGKFCHQLLTVMSFQTHKTFVHLQNTNEDIFNETWEICPSIYSPSRELSLVGPLPGANVKSYSGYLTVNKSYNSNLFFWFFPAQIKPESAPVLLWLQGGPGGTSMFGLFVEHGPYFVYKNLTLGYREFPWTSIYSVLYIDNPVGTGWSFTDDDKGFATNQDDVGRDLYNALVQFFQLFSEFQPNEFYATGESYAGKYVPAIGYYIHKNNPSAKVKINFKGVAIGDGLCDPEIMLGGVADFLYETGMVDELQKQYVKQQTDACVRFIQQEKWIEAFQVFDALMNGDLAPYPSFFQNATGCTNYYNFMQCQEPEDQEYFSKFVTLSTVRKSIHVGNLTFHSGTEVEKHLLQDVMQSIKPWLGVLMDNYRVLMYSGQLDVIVAAPLTERFLPTVNWTGTDAYKEAKRFYWKLQPSDTEIAGYFRQVEQFYQVIIRGGGHILPYDQPARAFDMMDRFLSTKGFA